MSKNKQNQFNVGDNVIVTIGSIELNAIIKYVINALPIDDIPKKEYIVRINDDNFYDCEFCVCHDDLSEVKL